MLVFIICRAAVDTLDLEILKPVDYSHTSVWDVASSSRDDISPPWASYMGDCMDNSASPDCQVGWWEHDDVWKFPPILDHRVPHLELPLKWVSEPTSSVFPTECFLRVRRIDARLAAASGHLEGKEQRLSNSMSEAEGYVEG